MVPRRTILRTSVRETARWPGILANPTGRAGSVYDPGSRKPGPCSGRRRHEAERGRDRGDRDFGACRRSGLDLQSRDPVASSAATGRDGSAPLVDLMDRDVERLGDGVLDEADG